MAHESDPGFRVLHALRVKGFAKVDSLAEVSGLSSAFVEEQLGRFLGAGWAVFREARSLWQLTPQGRVAHTDALARDVHEAGLRSRLGEQYGPFLALNEQFKDLCGEWQLRGDDPNDHTDAEYDAEVIARLLDVDRHVQPICASMAAVIDRLAPYGRRLRDAARRVNDGEVNKFTGVMCGSYHDIWMELHEDLILTLGIDRAKEGSF